MSLHNDNKFTISIKHNFNFEILFQQGKRPSAKHGHVVSAYHQFTDPDVYLKAYESPVLTGTPSPVPNYLRPKVAALSEETLLYKNLLPKRPATAGN